jgi:hypothetical protein
MPDQTQRIAPSPPCLRGDEPRTSNGIPLVGTPPAGTDHDRSALISILAHILIETCAQTSADAPVERKA